MRLLRFFAKDIFRPSACPKGEKADSAGGNGLADSGKAFRLGRCGQGSAGVVVRNSHIVLRNFYIVHRNVGIVHGNVGLPDRDKKEAADGHGNGCRRRLAGAGVLRRAATRAYLIYSSMPLRNESICLPSGCSGLMARMASQ